MKTLSSSWREKLYRYSVSGGTVLAVFSFLILSSANFLIAAQVTLEWDPNTEPNLAGYRLYYGPYSHYYTEEKDIGLEKCDENCCTCSVELPEGLWFFSVTAYDIYGHESGFSNQVWAKSPEICLGDFDQDGDVDGGDLSLLVADFGRTDFHDYPDCRTDVDKDGDVDIMDLKITADEYGRTDCREYYGEW
jgi:hypothetical protein